MPLSTYMHATTHRQHLAWVAWLEMQWNEPSRTDHYLMKIAYMLSTGEDLDMDRFRIRFGKQRKRVGPLTEQVAKMTEEEWEAERDRRCAVSKAMWRATMKP